MHITSWLGKIFTVTMFRLPEKAFVKRPPMKNFKKKILPIA